MPSLILCSICANHRAPWTWQVHLKDSSPPSSDLCLAQPSLHIMVKYPLPSALISCTTHSGRLSWPSPACSRLGKRGVPLFLETTLGFLSIRDWLLYWLTSLKLHYAPISPGAPNNTNSQALPSEALILQAGKIAQNVHLTSSPNDPNDLLRLVYVPHFEKYFSEPESPKWEVHPRGFFKMMHWSAGKKKYLNFLFPDFQSKFFFVCTLMVIVY